MIGKSSKSCNEIKWMKKVGEFYISDHLLGSGEYSEVYLGCFSSDLSKKVACKIMKTNSLESDPYVQETIMRQYKLLKLIDHENVVKLHETVKTSKNWYFFFEYCSLGTLENYMLHKKGKISEPKAFLIFLDICEGYKVLYKNSIIHRDLKPSNILMSENGVKISDFSFAKILDENQKNQMIEQSLVGTPVYSPLQILRGEKYSSKCDVWSLGIIFYQMLFGKPPFIDKYDSKNEMNLTFSTLIQKIWINQLEFPSSVKISKKVKNLIERMLEKDEEDRISWEELFEEASKIDFNDLNESIHEQKIVYNPLKENEKSGFMEKSIAISIFHSHLKASQKFNEENFQEIDLDEGSGILDVRKTKGIKSLAGSFNSFESLP